MTQTGMKDTLSAIFFEDEVREHSKLQSYIPKGTDVIMMVGMDINLEHVVNYCTKNGFLYYINELGSRADDTWEKAVYETIQDCENIVIVRENPESTFMEEFIATVKSWKGKRTYQVFYSDDDSMNAIV